MIATKLINPIMESDLSRPVTHWLEAQGFHCWFELRYATFTVDIVAERRGHVIACELKLCCNKWAVEQAEVSKVVADQTYLAVATQPHRESVRKCEAAKIGLLIVDPEFGKVCVRLDAPEIVPLGRRPDFIEYLHKQPKRDRGGVANVRDVEADRVTDAVIEFIGERMHVDWREIYDAVPSPKYQNFREMKADVLPRIKQKKHKEKLKA